jgi:hypothetical protein
METRKINATTALRMAAPPPLFDHPLARKAEPT